MFLLDCSKCGMSIKISLIDRKYEGPFRCWKCKSPFLVKIKDEELRSCRAIGEEEFQRYIE
jgi:hypothetical protein